MKCIYLKTVTSPEYVAGEAGDEKDLPECYARKLANEGYIEIQEEE
jgi:hypothetical protein